MSNATTLPEKACKKLLVIEDEGEMGLLLNLFLDEKDDLELDYVKDLASAREYLEKEKPSVIVLDNKLPDGFGVDFISFIKTNYPGTRVVMISGYGSAKDLALENGADVFLEKPFTRSQFYETIHD